ncbi:hypothetical protein ACFYZ9_39595 [Streptomyces sp. NPDC001691]|uniref:hypothetical protein n=1 Tax=Streptomyces sp. NPDC001691 TaxID=3364600 RepID=UPI0036790504
MPQAEPYGVLLAVFDDVLGVLTREHGALLLLGVLREGRRAAGPPEPLGIPRRSGRRGLALEPSDVDACLPAEVGAASMPSAPRRFSCSALRRYQSAVGG